MKRIIHEPAYVLHSYDWSESSLILEAFTRHYGRTALVAKGAKRPSSGFRPVLLPLQPLHIAYAGDAEIRTLKSAEWMGGHVMPTGDALLAGYYLNELIMRLPTLDVQTLNYQPLQIDAAYALMPESGLLAVPPTQARALPGRCWLALQAAMDDAAPLRALLSLCLAQRDVALALKPQLRELLYYHCGVSRLRTRQLLVDLHNL